VTVLPRILVVDDNLDLAQNLVEILEDAGYEAECFDDPARALSALAVGRYRLAIIDLRMPGLDGVDFNRALKRRDPALKTVAMTAYERDERVRVALDDGVIAVLPKPLTAPDLVARVQGILAS
jgi:CheY-like chemotaxis protein